MIRCLVIVTIVLVACAEPPATSINGIAGYTWGGTWGDGFTMTTHDVGALPDISRLPTISEPPVIQLPAKGTIRGAMTWESSEHDPTIIDFTDTTIGTLPDDAVVLALTVFWNEHENATYLWRLEPST